MGTPNGNNFAIDQAVVISALPDGIAIFDLQVRKDGAISGNILYSLQIILLRAKPLGFAHSPCDGHPPHAKSGVYHRVGYPRK
jgi:hypothetical protein